MGLVLTWGLPCFLEWEEHTKLAWLAQGSRTYIPEVSFFLCGFFLVCFFCFVFLSCLNHCVLFCMDGLVWVVLFGMCSCLRCRLLAKRCLGWRVCKLGTRTAWEHHGQQLLNIRNPLAPPDPPGWWPLCVAGVTSWGPSWFFPNGTM